jgi:hypothetical protein
MDSTITSTSLKLQASNLPINYFPNSKEFIFEEDKLIFSSKFDSGNLFNAHKYQPLTVNI